MGRTLIPEKPGWSLEPVITTQNSISRNNFQELVDNYRFRSYCVGIIEERISGGPRKGDPMIRQEGQRYV